jgi:hypothetical protein
MQPGGLGRRSRGEGCAKASQRVAGYFNRRAPCRQRRADRDQVKMTVESKNFGDLMTNLLRMVRQVGGEARFSDPLNPSRQASLTAGVTIASFSPGSENPQHRQRGSRLQYPPHEGLGMFPTIHNALKINAIYYISRHQTGSKSAGPQNSLLTRWPHCIKLALSSREC